MAKLKGLGRGLDALLAGSDEISGGESLQSLPVDRIGVGKYQPRTHMDEHSLAELAESIKAQGIVQPILVRPVDGGRYELIAGERRWRAAQRAGLKEVPAVVRAVPLFLSDGTQLYPSLAMEALRVAQGASSRDLCANDDRPVDLVDGVVAGSSEGEIRKLYRDNAIEFYRL